MQESQEIMLVGAITRVHLHDGQLEVTMGGQPMTFPLEAAPAQAPKPRQPRKANGHAQEGPQDAGAAE